MMILRSGRNLKQEGVEGAGETSGADEKSHSGSNSHQAGLHTREKPPSVISGASHAASVRNRCLQAEIEAERAIFEKEKEFIRKKLDLEKQIIEEEEMNHVIDQVDDLQLPDEGVAKTPENRTEDWVKNSPHIKSHDDTDDMKTLIQNMTDAFRSLGEQKTEANILKTFLARNTSGKELPIFSGDAEDWPSFISQFRQSTKICGYTPEENLLRLQKALKGRAKEAVRSILYLPKQLDNVLRILSLNFGRPGAIIKTMIEKAKSIPSPREDRPEAIMDFSNSVTNLVATMKSLKCTGHMSNPQLVEDLVCKLPSSLRFRWGMAAASMGDEEPNLKEFCAWLEEIAFAASFIPVPSATREQFKDGHQYNERMRGFKPNQRTPVFSTVTRKQNHPCVFCGTDGHVIATCEQFRPLDPAHKRKWVNEARLCFCCLQGGHGVRNCRQRRTCGIRGCFKSHHKMLHCEEDEKRPEHVGLHAMSTAPTQGKTGDVVAHSMSTTSNVLLRVVPITVFGPKGKLSTYAIFDEGSTVTLMDSDLATEIGANGKRVPLHLSWIHDSCQSEKNSMMVTVDVQGVDSACTYKLHNVRTIPNLSLPRHSLDVEKLKMKWTHLEKIDVPSMRNVQPRILIGQDNCRLIIPREVMEGPPNAPVVTNSLLGWSVHGNNGLIKSRVDHGLIFHTRESPEEELHRMVKESFTTENFGVVPPKKPLVSYEEERAIKILEATTRRVGNRWDTGLLWRDENITMPDSYEMARRRLGPVEKQMKTDETFSKLYQDKIKEYIDKGYARKITKSETKQNPRTWYIPHFAVYNINKPGKIRVVFDAAARSHGKSLNDCLLAGPDLLNPLIGVLFKFRQKEIGFGGDIQEMFNRVFISEEDVPAQRFLWRDGDWSRNPEIYEMKAMIFGSTSSPTCAQYVKNKNAMEFQDEFPEAANAIINRVYVDDYFDSAHTTDEAAKMIHEVTEVNMRGGFTTRNWMCTSATVLETIPAHLRSEKNQTTINPAMERVLGVNWDAKIDCFTFLINLTKIPIQIVNGEKNPTKREMLRVIMSLFDPLGFLTNFTVAAKILMQDVWRVGLGWDDEVSGEILEKWKIWLHGLREIRNCEIDRCYSKNMLTCYRIELHIFTDASEKAFAAVGYFKVFTTGGIDVSFVMAKSRVSPLRPMTIPRLELQAAVLGSRMAATIVKNHEIKINAIHYWTDSATVLRWLRSETIHLKQFKQFVAFRVGEILEATDVSSWHWVPTKENPADDATRDSTTPDLSSSSRWLNGPDFLKKEPTEWPREKETMVGADDTEETRKCAVLTVCEMQIEHLPCVRRFSSWKKLIRATGWILRYVWNSRNKEKRTGSLTVDEILVAERYWTIATQKQSFPEEYSNLMKKRKISKSSRLYKLDLHLDENSVIRLTGRLRNAPLLTDTIHPVILDGDHPYTRLLLQKFHTDANHCGMELVANEVRQKYWIVGLRKAVRRTWNDCQTCLNRRVKQLQPRMGDLPITRVTKTVRAFVAVGLDYFGPLHTKNGHKREKRYGVMFTCMVTRAIHLEVASSLSTECCILAIRRFVARRGLPTDIYSDNGTNLRGAEAEIRNAIVKLEQDQIRDFLAVREIKWHFNPPSCPHFGGTWERLIRSVKSTLKSTIANYSPRDDMLMTILTEVESLVNSSPLTFVSLDHKDDKALTPNHFLLGASSPASCPGIFENVLISRKDWKNSQLLLNNFWKRWTKEYLPSLTRRTKWIQPSRPIGVDSIVIIADSSLPRGCWPKGIVTEVYTGKDGITRVVNVKTQFGTFRRPVTKLCLLDVHKL